MQGKNQSELLDLKSKYGLLEEIATKEEYEKYRQEVFSKNIVWYENTNVLEVMNFPFEAKFSNSIWKLRLNNFPKEPLYTLIIDGKPKLSFDGIPPNWILEGYLEATA